MVINNHPETDDANEPRRFRLFGHTLISNRTLASWLPSSLDVPDLTVSFVSQPPVAWNPANTPAVFSSLSKSDQGQSILRLYILGSCKIIRFLEYADFYLWPDRLDCCLQENAPPHLIQSFLFSNVLPLWLELQGFVTLHASVVNLPGNSFPGNAIAFLAHSRNGKSTLAASLLREGASLLTDDVLPLRIQEGGYWAYPSYPAIRMWPDEAGHFLDEYEHLERVHPELDKRYVPLGEGQLGLFCDHPCPLGRIYLLERRGASELTSGVQIEGIPQREAVIELLRYSFVTRISEAVGLAADRFVFISGLVRKVPVRRLFYPSGYEYLPEVRQSIINDLSS